MPERLPPGISRRGAKLRVHVYAGRDPLTGRQRLLTGTAATLREAKELQARLRLRAATQTGAPASLTVSQALARWLEFAAPELSPTSWNTAETHIRVHLVPRLGRLRLARLTTADLDRCYRDMVTAGLSAAYVRRVHTTARSMLAAAVRWGWLPASPATQASPPTARRPRIRPPDPGQVADLLAAAAATGGPRLALLVRLAAVTGARRGELVALRWSGFDPDRRTLTFAGGLVQGAGDLGRRGTRRKGGRLVEQRLKGRADDEPKLVALDPATVSQLQAWRRQCDELALAVGRRLDPTCYVFSQDPGGRVPPRPDTLGRQFARARAAAGVPATVRLHDLRHFVATILLAEGVPDVIVAGRLGHQTSRTTRDLYSHFMPASDRHAAELLALLLDRDRTVTGRAVSPGDAG